MAIKPILFNSEMVRAILDGRKDATRKIVKGFIPDDAVWGYTAFTPKGYISCRGTFADGYGEKFFKLPCEPGDILYVRETWCKGYLMNAKERYYYKADDNDFLCTWHPSTNMPKQAARIWLRVMDVRVERLQEITAESALTEGADKYIHANGTLNEDQTITSFIGIWNSTIKKSDIDRYGWDANPYVWVIEFERCEKLKGA